MWAVARDHSGVPASRSIALAVAAVACAGAGAQAALAGTPGASCEAQAVSFRSTDTARFTWRLPVALRYHASAKVQVRRAGADGDFITLSNTSVASAGTRTWSASIGNPRLDAGTWDWRMFLTEWDGTLIWCDGPPFVVTRPPAPGVGLIGPGTTADGWRRIANGQDARVTPASGDEASGSTSLVRFRYASGSWSSYRSAPADLPDADITAIEAYRRTADGMTGDTRTVIVRRDSWSPTVPVPHRPAVDVADGGTTVSFASSTDWLSGIGGYEARTVPARGEASPWKAVGGPSVRVAASAAGATLQLRACDRVGNCSEPADVLLTKAGGGAPESAPGGEPAQPPPSSTARGRSPRVAPGPPRISALIAGSPRRGAGRVTVELSRPAEVTLTFRGSTLARAWLGTGRTVVRLPAQPSARRGTLVARPVAGLMAGEAVSATVSLPGGGRKGEAARAGTSLRPGSVGVLYDMDAAVREVVDPADGAPGFTHARGALRQEPSTSGLFHGDDDGSRMAKVTEEDLRGLPAAQIAQVLRDEIEGSDSNLVAFDELTPYEADPKGPVVKGGRIPPPNPASPGAQLAQALALLDVPSPYGGTWASRVHVYIAPAVSSAIAVGRGPDRNWGRDGKARFRTYRTVMAGLAKAGGVWIEAYHGKTVPLQPFTAEEWRKAPAAFTAEYRRAGGDPSRLHFLITGTDAYPPGRLVPGCTTPMACQWAMAESTPAGRAILANGVGGYRLGAHARPWLAEWQARVS